MLRGSLVAIATPMQPGGTLDLPGLCKLIDFHVANGTSGIVVVGTTGESPTVSFEEHCLLIKTAVEHAKGRIPVIAGTGSNSTAEAIEQTPGVGPKMAASIATQLAAPGGPLVVALVLVDKKEPFVLEGGLMLATRSSSRNLAPLRRPHWAATEPDGTDAKDILPHRRFAAKRPRR